MLILAARPRSSRILAGAALATVGVALAVACSPQPVESSQRMKPASPATQGATPGVVTPAGAIDYKATVLPILKASCGTASCHGPGSVFSVYDADESVFLKDGQTVLVRLAATDDTVMPKPGFGMVLSPTKSQTLQAYLAQHEITATQDGPAGDDAGDGAADAGTDEDVTRPPSADVVKVCAKVSAADKVSGLMLTYADVRPIGEAACGGGGCHSGALPRGFVPVESQWTHDTYGMGIVTNILNGGMPIGGRSISEADKTKMVSYICARKDF